MAGLNNTAKNAMLDATSSVWPPDTFALYDATADPGTGTSVNGSAVELTGGSPAYARKSASWSAASSASKVTSAGVVFDVPSGATVAYVAYYRSTTYLGCRAVTSQAFASQGTYTVTTATESLT